MVTRFDKSVLPMAVAVFAWMSSCRAELISYYHLGGESDRDAAAGDPDAAPCDSGDTEEGVAQKGLTVYYIRHAETEANAHGIAGRDDEGHSALTPLGLEQKKALSTYLVENDIVPDAVIVSPTWRTQQTIEPFLIATSTTAEIWVELTEIYSLQPTGAPLPTAPTISDEAVTIEAENIRFRDDTPAYFWQTDTYEEELFMVMTARDKIMNAFSQTGKTIIVVGHMLAGNLLIGLWGGHDMLTDIPARLQIENTGIQKLVQDVATSEMKLVEENMNDPQSK